MVLITEQSIVLCQNTQLCPIERLQDSVKSQNCLVNSSWSLNRDDEYGSIRGLQDISCRLHCKHSELKRHVHFKLKNNFKDYYSFYFLFIKIILNTLLIEKI